MKRLALLILASLWTGQLTAEASNVLVWETGKDLETSYKVVYKSLEENRLYVVFEPNIQRNLSSFAERWGDNYNRNKLEGIRAMVFCNAWHANAVSNADPDMLALCPLHVTLIQKDGNTRILFLRPTAIAKGTDAEAVASELEKDVTKAIEQALAELR